MPTKLVVLIEMILYELLRGERRPEDEVDGDFGSDRLAIESGGAKAPFLSSFQREGSARIERADSLPGGGHSVWTYCDLDDNGTRNDAVDWVLRVAGRDNGWKNVS